MKIPFQKKKSWNSKRRASKTGNAVFFYYRTGTWKSWILQLYFQDRLLGDSAGLKKLAASGFYYCPMHRAKLTTQPRYQHLRSRHHKQTDNNHPGGWCLYAPNKHFLQLIGYEVWYSARYSTIQLWNSLPFDVKWMEKLTRTKCTLTGIHQVILSVRKWGSERIWQLFDPSDWTAQRCGEEIQCSTSIIWISHLLPW